MRFSNWTGIDLRLLIGNLNDDEPTATVKLIQGDSVDIPEHAFDTVLIRKLEEDSSGSSE